MKSYQYLAERLDRIAALAKLRKEVDPASGMSVMVRRGVIADDPHDPDKDGHRPWIALETAEGMEEILTKLIATQERSAAFWARCVIEDAAKGSVVLEAYNAHMAKLKKEAEG